MGRAFVEPSTLSYSAAITACEKAAKWQDPWLVHFHGPYRRQTRHQQPVQQSVHVRRAPNGNAVALLATTALVTIEPGNFSYNAVTSACEKGADWQTALALLAAGPGFRWQDR